MFEVVKPLGSCCHELLGSQQQSSDRLLVKLEVGGKLVAKNMAQFEDFTQMSPRYVGIAYDPVSLLRR